jgi:hypothetical protein
LQECLAARHRGQPGQGGDEAGGLDPQDRLGLRRGGILDADVELAVVYLLDVLGGSSSSMICRTSTRQSPPPAPFRPLERLFGERAWMIQ